MAGRLATRGLTGSASGWLRAFWRQLASDWTSPLGQPPGGGSLVGICPGTIESAGKRLSGKTLKVNPPTRVGSHPAAHLLAHSKNTYLAAHTVRLPRACGPTRSPVAVWPYILVISTICSRSRTYENLGGIIFD